MQVIARTRLCDRPARCRIGRGGTSARNRRSDRMDVGSANPETDRGDPRMARQEAHPTQLDRGVRGPGPLIDRRRPPIRSVRSKSDDRPIRVGPVAAGEQRRVPAAPAPMTARSSDSVLRRCAPSRQPNRVDRPSIRRPSGAATRGAGRCGRVSKDSRASRLARLRSHALRKPGAPARYLADRPVICSVVGSLKLPLPFTPFTSDVFMAYWSVAYAMASAFVSSAPMLLFSKVSHAWW